MALDYITEVRFFGQAKGPVLTRGSFTVADALAVNFTIFKGKDDQPRLVLPNTPNPNYDANSPVGNDNKKYFDEVRPISKLAREELEKHILEKFSNQNSASPVKGSKNTDDDHIPF